MTVQDEIWAHLEETGETKRALSLRAGLNEKFVSNLLTRDGQKSRYTNLLALSHATGRDLVRAAGMASLTYDRLIGKLEADGRKVSVSRIRWIMRKENWYGNRVVCRHDVIDFFACHNAASLGLSPGSRSTYKSDLLAAIDGHRGRNRPRGIADIGGVWDECYRAALDAEMPTDCIRKAGPFFVYLFDRQILPENVTPDVLGEYFAYRLEHGVTTEAKCRKHVANIVTLIRHLATDPRTSRFGFGVVASPFTDRRDKFGVDDALARHLAERREQAGDAAFAEFAYLQKVAAETWGAGPTAHFARVLRDARVSPKPRDGCRWAQAERLVASLPEEWRPRLSEQIMLSRKGRAVLGKTIWSVDYTCSVVTALNRWAAYCTATEQPLRPTGTALHAYARKLTEPMDGKEPVSAGTAANYLQRILAGLAVATGGQFRSEVCEFVAADWQQKAAGTAAVTKTGSQLVGARTLYAFGFRLMEAARTRPVRGIGAATCFRNGLIFAVGAALPERARALTYLTFDRTLTLTDGTHVHVDLPGKALKCAEARKRSEGYDVIFENAGLASALHEYRAIFRPLFDDGDHLFPSVHGKPGAITPQHLGRLTGNLTEREFGVRIPLHRLRDNVATEAAENMVGGIYAAKTLLRVPRSSGHPFR